MGVGAFATSSNASLCDLLDGVVRRSLGAFLATEETPIELLAHLSPTLGAIDRRLGVLPVHYPVFQIELGDSANQVLFG